MNLFLKEPRFRNEDQFTDWTIERINAAGGFVFAVVGAMLQKKGYPDRRVSSRHFLGCIEFKYNHNVLNENQKEVHWKLNRQYDVVAILRYYPDSDIISFGYWSPVGRVTPTLQINVDSMLKVAKTKQDQGVFILNACEHMRSFIKQEYKDA